MSAMARCITTNTATACAGWPLCQIQTSGNNRTSVTRMARRKNNHRGAELIRVTTGQAAHAMSTPTTVSLA